MHSFDDKKNAAQYAKGLILHSKPGSQLIITITPEKSGGYFVTSVTEELWADTETPKSLKELMSISLKERAG